MIAWLLSPIGRLIGGGAAILFFVSAFALDQRNRGAERALAKVERNNAEVSSKAGSAGRKSLDPSSGGVRNPYYRD